MRNICWRETIVGLLMKCLLIPSITLELSQARWTFPPLQTSCQSRKTCRIANISFQSIFLNLCRDGILSEKINRLYTPLISFASLASMTISKKIRDNWIIEMKKQDMRNYNHHLRSFHESWMSRNRRCEWLLLRQIWEKRLRRKDRSRETTWQ